MSLYYQKPEAFPVAVGIQVCSPRVEQKLEGWEDHDATFSYFFFGRDHKNE